MRISRVVFSSDRFTTFGGFEVSRVTASGYTLIMKNRARACMRPSGYSRGSCCVSVSVVVGENPSCCRSWYPFFML